MVQLQPIENSGSQPLNENNLPHVEASIRVPKELKNDFLIVSRLDEPPNPAAFVRALAAADLGIAEYTPPSKPTHSGPGVGRIRLGVYTIVIAGLRTVARIAPFHPDGPVMAGMGEETLATLARDVPSEGMRTLREGALGVDLRLRGPEQEALESLDWALRALRVLLNMTQGVCVDPAAQRCYDANALAQYNHGDPLTHIAFHSEPWQVETRWLHTHGMQKFGRPELDLVTVPLSLEAEGLTFLREVAASLANGAELSPGKEIHVEEAGLAIAVGAPTNSDHQATYGRLRLADLAAPGERQGMSIAQLLARMALNDATQASARGDMKHALATIERALAANPDNYDALMLKARLYLRLEQPVDALDLGELMELRSPSDYRGALVMGMALIALGRYSEALHALTRAIDREPEIAEAFLLRAKAYERVGDKRQAALDHTRAKYLA